VANLTIAQERQKIKQKRAFLVKRDAFRAGQKVYIFAGRDRYETANAWRESYLLAAEEVKYGR